MFLQLQFISYSNQIDILLYGQKVYRILTSISKSNIFTTYTHLYIYSIFEQLILS